MSTPTLEPSNVEPAPKNPLETQNQNTKPSPDPSSEPRHASNPQPQETLPKKDSPHAIIVQSGMDARTKAKVLEPWVTETREAQRSRIQEIFSKLDRKGAGVLDAEAVRHGMSTMKRTHVSYASELLRVCDSTNDGLITFPEFEKYIHAKEKELWHLFKEIDVSGDGHIQPEELMKALEHAGIVLNSDELDDFISHMDANKDGIIDFIEWRDYLLLLPKNANLNNIYHFYRKSVSHVDVEGNVHIPPPKGESTLRTTGYFIAGGFAGAVSRTCTAPLDRLKVFFVTQTLPNNAIRPPSKLFAPWSAGGIASSSASVPKLHLAERIWKGRAVEAVKYLYDSGGIKTFFRGNGINVLKIAPESAIKFWCYESGKTFLASFTSNSNPTSHAYSTAASRRSDSNAIGITGRFLAGGTAGMTSQLCMYPLETVKTRIMAITQDRFESRPSYSGASSAGISRKSSHHPSVKPPTNSCFSTVPPVIPTSQSSSLHPHIFRSTAANHFIFRSRASMTALPPPRDIAKSAPLTPPRNLASLSGTRSASPSPYLLSRTVQQMWKEGGIRTFYKGLGPAMLGVFPYAAIDMSIFESLKLQWMKYRAGGAANLQSQEHIDTPPAVILLGCGTVSGLVGASSVYPLSLVRTILQAQGTSAHPATYNGAMDVIRKTYVREGIRGFYKGLAPTLMKVVPSASIAYVTYEKSLEQFGLK